MKYLNWYNQLVELGRTQTLNESIYTEVHHVVPRHMAGGDNSNNLVTLSFRQHILAHLLLWKIYNRTEDELAYKFMKGIGLGDRKRMLASLGGTKQGNTNVKNGHMERIRHLVDWSANGKRSAEICRKRKVNAFFDPILKAKSSSLGGKKQGRINVLSGHLKRIAKLPRKRKMSDVVWVTNGKENKWHNKNENVPEGWWRGRTLRQNKQI